MRPFCRQRLLYLKMLVQAVGVPVLELGGALDPRGGLWLLHSWNMDSRTFGRDTAETVPESCQHNFRGLYTYSLLLFSLARKRNDFTCRDARLFLPPGATPSRKWRLSEDVWPVYVSISHRLFPLNNKSRVTTTDCSTALVEKKGRGGGERAIKDTRHASTAVKCHRKLGWEIFPYNIPFVIA